MPSDRPHPLDYAHPRSRPRSAFWPLLRFILALPFLFWGLLMVYFGILSMILESWVYVGEILFGVFLLGVAAAALTLPLHRPTPVIPVDDGPEPADPR